MDDKVSTLQFTVKVSISFADLRWKERMRTFLGVLKQKHYLWHKIENRGWGLAKFRMKNEKVGAENHPQRTERTLRPSSVNEARNYLNTLKGTKKFPAFFLSIQNHGELPKLIRFLIWSFVHCENRS